MDKNKKKRGKFILSLLLLLVVGTAGTTGYAVVTGHMPPIITSDKSRKRINFPRFFLFLSISFDLL